MIIKRVLLAICLIGTSYSSFENDEAESINEDVMMEIKESCQRRVQKFLSKQVESSVEKFKKGKIKLCYVTHKSLGGGVDNEYCVRILLCADKKMQAETQREVLCELDGDWNVAIDCIYGMRERPLIERFMGKCAECIGLLIKEIEKTKKVEEWGAEKEAGQWKMCGVMEGWVLADYGLGKLIKRKWIGEWCMARFWRNVEEYRKQHGVIGYNHDRSANFLMDDCYRMIGYACKRGCEWMKHELKNMLEWNVIKNG